MYYKTQAKKLVKRKWLYVKCKANLKPSEDLIYEELYMGITERLSLHNLM